MKHIYLIILVYVALTGSFFSVSADDGLPYVIFNDTTLRRPAIQAIDAQVNLTLTGYNDCSILWLGNIQIPGGVEITFEAEVQQGIRLYIDNKLVIDGWGPDASRTGTFISNSDNSLPFRLEYYHNGGEAYTRLYWSWAGRPRELIPASAFTHTQTDLQHVNAIAQDKELVGLKNQGPFPAPDEPIIKAPMGDEAMHSSVYVPGSFNRSTGPIQLAPGPQLFIDDYLIESSNNVMRRVNVPQRDPAIPNPVINGIEDKNYQPYLTVLRDVETEKFRMWYGAYGASPDGMTSHIGYIESTDGINWERPALILDDPAAIQFGSSVLDEGPDFHDPVTRYKLAWWSDGGLKIATSPDGLQWTSMRPYAVIEHNHDINNIFRDPLRNCYVATMSVYTTGDNWPGLRRVTLQSTSPDLLHWEKPWLILTPDEKTDQGETQFYAMNGHLTRGGLWIGLVKVLRDDLRASDTPEGSYGIGYTTLAWTRDGINWVRDTTPYFEPDPQPGAWDHAHAWMDWQILVDDEVYIYYGGYKNGHKVNRFEERQIGVIRIRQDRYVSREVYGSEGLLHTPLVIIDADELTVNAKITGALHVRIIDEVGQVIPGFDFTDCTAITGDAIAHPVNWTGDLKNLHGRPVHLEFRLKDAELYAFELR